ncbi:MAG: hypothetical protein WC866_00790 [Patescibacteria group bacterium]
MHLVHLILLGLGLAAIGVLPLLFARCWKAAAYAFGAFALIGPPLMLMNDHSWVDRIGATIFFWHTLSLFISMFTLYEYGEDWKRRPLIWVVPLVAFYLWFAHGAFIEKQVGGEVGANTNSITITVTNK